MNKDGLSSKELARPTLGSVTMTLLALAYPFVIWVGLTYWNTKALALMLLPLFGFRLLVQRLRGQPSQGLWQLSLVVVVLAVLALFLDRGELFLYYPVFVNAALFSVFGLSLQGPRSLVEKFARMKEPDLPDEAVAYCRKVTFAWCIFFILNGGISLFTVIRGDLGLWTFYNGFLSYVLIGMFFACEFGIRCLFKRRLARRTATGSIER